MSTCKHGAPLGRSCQLCAFVQEDTLRAATLERVEPIRDSPTGVLSLLKEGGQVVGVARTVGGQVELMISLADSSVIGLRLHPAESKWLRETLEKVGY